MGGRGEGEVYVWHTEMVFYIKSRERERESLFIIIKCVFVIIRMASLVMTIDSSEDEGAN